MTEAIVFQSAADQVEAISSGRLSAVELMNATYDRIESVNPDINALVSVLPRDRALALAAESDRLRASDPNQCGVLEGLPIAVKDLADAEGFPTTFGFVPFKDRIAAGDSPTTAKQKAAGAIVFAKSNAPEFGFGSHTFNKVFGTTRNPYNLGKTAGGSSGGAAAALAARMVSVSDGSDFGGSLRNPAAFCNVVGFRPSIGRVAGVRALGWLGRIATEGPMARNVADLARLFSVQAGPDPTDPLSLPEPGSVFRGDLSIDPKHLNIACSADLGFLPLQPAVRELFETVPHVFEDLGCRVEQDHPELSGAMEVFQAQRALNVSLTARMLERDVPDWRRYAKDTAIWNFEKGAAVTASEIMVSESRRMRIYQETAKFFERYDALILPVAQVVPFDVETEWVRRIDDVAMATYLDWMSVCCVISVTGLPAISVPGGFTEDGLPFGVQIVGAPRADLTVLKIAQLFERATGFAAQAPDL